MTIINNNKVNGYWAMFWEHYDDDKPIINLYSKQCVYEWIEDSRIRLSTCDLSRGSSLLCLVLIDNRVMYSNTSMLSKCVRSSLSPSKLIIIIEAHQNHHHHYHCSSSSLSSSLNYASSMNLWTYLIVV